MQHVGKLDSIDADRTMKDIYEFHHGIFQHGSANNKQRPLASIAALPAEENGKTSLLYSRIKEFVDLKIYEAIGVNLNDFLKMPTEIVEWLIEMIKEKRKMESDVVNGINLPKL